MKRVVFLKYDDGTILSDQQYNDAEERLGAPLWRLHRADLHDVLLAKARELGVEITMGAKVKSFDWQAPSASLEGGEAVRADVILAADGQLPVACASRDARKIGGTTLQWKLSIQNANSSFCVRERPKGLRRFSTSRPKRVACGEVGEGCHVLLYPIRQGEYLNVVATQPANHTKGPKYVVSTDPKKFLDRYKNWDSTLVGVLERLPKDNLLEWKLCDLEPMETWLFPGRKIALLGDASHAMLPSAAQGASMGIEDCSAIAELLARAEHRDQIPQVLKAFRT
ncbi:uncharacterized protein PAC_15027 [Phialocephala subalpina]|uniref:FAD-binding domain-containing protein n=1 Tax=Phialocephala subalpina TaxID=576137 RepID=A0A1L7XJK0_9HELO|nr:uncharacterized protein PAC_15027 [Phialocephala subalpina]